MVLSLTAKSAYIFNKEDMGEAFRNAVDEYLKYAITNRAYLVTDHKKDADGKAETLESVLH